jgi:hypothetical protein
MRTPSIKIGIDIRNLPKFIIPVISLFDILRIFHELGFVEIIKFGKIKLNYMVVEK